MNVHEWLPGWKVTTIFGHSAIVGLARGGRDYRGKQPVMPVPGHGPLCCFTTRGQAERFLTSLAQITDYRIRPCAYVPSTARSVWRIQGEGLVIPLRDLPAGTALADVIIVLD